MKVSITGDFGIVELPIQERMSTFAETSARELVRSIVENGGVWNEDNSKFFPLHRIDLFEIVK